MKIKKGDKVTVISGKDKGKNGVVERAFPKLDRIIVGGVNVVKKHVRSKKSGTKGQIVERPMPIHVSNVKKTV
jgi:large subunit ribosomal protein L24